MDNLEHNIKKAFAEHDSNTELSDKSEMWSRLNNAMHNSKGVTPLWRIAAVFAGLLLVAGAIAGISVRQKLQSEITELNNQNTKQQITIDSLLTRPNEVKTEIKEIEKVVYRDRIVYESIEETTDWKTKYVQLKDSADKIIAQKENAHSDELKQLKVELESVNKKLIAFQNESKRTEQTAKDPFQLKSERVELGIQNTPVTKSQGIEVKILPQNFTGNKNNLNKTLLNNLP